MDAPTVLFAAGGTGGHIFPALAIADELRAIHPSLETVFLASERKVDRQILDAARVPWAAIPARPFVMRPKPLASLLWNWPMAVGAARKVMRTGHDLKNVPENSIFSKPLAIVTTGGFVAAPAARAARKEKIPLVLINLDAVPGRANRLLAKHAKRMLTSADAPEVPPSWARIPPIVRREAKATIAPEKARLSFGLDPKTPTLLVTGGSQGAHTINQFMAAVVKDKPEILKGWQVVHQAGVGEATAKALQDAYDAAKIPASVVEFIDNMADAWAAADFAIARAGAGNVAEVWANRVPTLFLPYPFHADNHQQRNALALTSRGAAIITNDLIDPAKNLMAVGPVLRDHLTTPEKRAGIATALAALGPADGAPRAARAIAELIAPSGKPLRGK